MTLINNHLDSNLSADHADPNSVHHNNTTSTAHLHVQQPPPRPLPLPPTTSSHLPWGDFDLTLLQHHHPSTTAALLATTLLTTTPHIPSFHVDSIQTFWSTPPPHSTPCLPSAQHQEQTPTISILSSNAQSLKRRRVSNDLAKVEEKRAVKDKKNSQRGKAVVPMEVDVKRMNHEPHDDLQHDEHDDEEEQDGDAGSDNEEGNGGKGNTTLKKPKTAKEITRRKRNTEAAKRSRERKNARVSHFSNDIFRQRRIARI
ncbi:hypothetical protein BC829DRAFT_398234, partial [Chytridium lagenaria]